MSPAHRDRVARAARCRSAQMGSPATQLDVGLVVMPALTAKEQAAAGLARLIELLQDDALRAALVSRRDAPKRCARRSQPAGRPEWTLSAAVHYVLDLGAPVMMPIIITLLGLALRQGLAKSFRAGLTVGVGFVAIGLVVGLLVQRRRARRRWPSPTCSA